MQQTKTDNPGRTTGLLVREGARAEGQGQTKCRVCLCPACESGYHEDTVYGDFQCECPCHGKEAKQ